jgi:hypothetical protein
MSRYIENAQLRQLATAWWILFNPAALAVIEVVFLNGVDTPAVLQAGPDYQFDRLGDLHPRDDAVRRATSRTSAAASTCQAPDERSRDPRRRRPAGPPACRPHTRGRTSSQQCRQGWEFGRPAGRSRRRAVPTRAGGPAPRRRTRARGPAMTQASFKYGKPVMVKNNVSRRRLQRRRRGRDRQRALRGARGQPGVVRQRAVPDAFAAGAACTRWPPTRPTRSAPRSIGTPPQQVTTVYQANGSPTRSASSSAGRPATPTTAARPAPRVALRRLPHARSPGCSQNPGRAAVRSTSAT